MAFRFAKGVQIEHHIPFRIICGVALDRGLAPQAFDVVGVLPEIPQLAVAHAHIGDAVGGLQHFKRLIVERVIARIRGEAIERLLVHLGCEGEGAFAFNVFEPFKAFGFRLDGGVQLRAGQIGGVCHAGLLSISHVGFFGRRTGRERHNGGGGGQVITPAAHHALPLLSDCAHSTGGWPPGQSDTVLQAVYLAA